MNWYNRLSKRFVFHLLFLWSIFSFFSCATSKEKAQAKSEHINSGLVNILQYGAIPNDGTDDSEAIQTAVDEAIQNGGPSQLYIPPGTYDLEKGIVVSHPVHGEYFFVTMKISGQIPGFSNNPNIGANSVLRNHGNGFTLAIQNGRQCVIENIVFEGPGNELTTPAKILQAKPNDWSSSGNVRADRYSPECAVAIDPFHQQVPTGHRYPGFDKLYSNASMTGSSMITLRECSFVKHYIGIANNPAIGSANGDNIRVENSYVQSCHTFWACGQTQSRSNSISNVYALFVDTFIDNKMIGQQQGTPPTVDHLNLAGFCKEVFHVETAFSGLGITQSYMENIWSLGVANTNSVDFNQCQFQFIIPDSTIDAPPFQLYTSGVVNFTGCSIEYFNNCESPVPFVFKSAGVNITGGHIEGGIVLADGISNEGGENLHRVNYDFVQLKCQQSILNRRETGVHLSNLYNHVLLGGTVITTYDQQSYLLDQPTYNLYKTENISLTRNTNHTVSFISAKPYIYKIGDNLLCDQWYDLSFTGMENRKIRGVLGYVSKIENKLITLSGVPGYIQSGPMNIYYVGYFQLSPELRGQVHQGSNIIHLEPGSSQAFKTGERIDSPYFEKGVYILSIEGNIITVSAPSRQSSSGSAMIAKLSVIHND